MRIAKKLVARELERIYRDDQADRELFSTSAPSRWDDAKHIAAREKMARNDEFRLARVEELAGDGLIEEPQDCFHAAMVYQHGTEPEHYLKAHKFACRAALAGLGKARKLTAQTLDRFLLSQEHPQIVGTQYYTQSPANMGNFDTSLPDAARVAMGARTLEQSRVLLDALDNGSSWDNAVAASDEVKIPHHLGSLLRMSNASLSGNNLVEGYALAVAAAFEGEAGAGEIATRMFEKLQKTFAGEP